MARGKLPSFENDTNEYFFMKSINFLFAQLITYWSLFTYLFSQIYNFLNTSLSTILLNETVTNPIVIP